MAWQILTKEHLLARLSGPEHQALDTAALEWTQSDPLAEVAHEVADDWRGGLRRVTTLDKRPDAVPSEVLIHLLADFRYRAFTRLPGMQHLLDERRVAEWQRAMAIRDALAKLSYEPPEPENVEDPTAVSVPLPKIVVTHAHLLD
ncbi:MAG: hypothetical protein ACI4RT_05390 [Candidatus Spyradenecus sp.]